MIKTFRGALVATLAITLALVPEGPSAAGEKRGRHGCTSSLQEAGEAFNQAFVARDLETYLGFIAEDAMQVDSAGNVYLGKEAIAGFTEAVMANEYTFTATLINRTVRPCSSATVLEDTVFSIPSVPLTLHLLDAVSWVRSHGRWRIVMIQNTVVPASPAEPATSAAARPPANQPSAGQPSAGQPSERAEERATWAD